MEKLLKIGETNRKLKKTKNIIAKKYGNIVGKNQKITDFFDQFKQLETINEDHELSSESIKKRNFKCLICQHSFENNSLESIKNHYVEKHKIEKKNNLFNLYLHALHKKV